MKDIITIDKSNLPVDIVLSPEWWFKNEKICFDRDFFYHPAKRVEVEQQMENILYERWGKFGLGKDKEKAIPEIGAVHLAAGFLVSEMLGCQINYFENHPPQVIPLHQDKMEISIDKAFSSKSFSQLTSLENQLKTKYGYLKGDINRGGILNIAMDLRGEDIFTDMMMVPDEVEKYFSEIAEVLEKFTNHIFDLTGTTSISVNRCVRHIENPILLHSECSHTMISADDYETFLLPYDIKWSAKRPYGIHYCGSDPHRMAASFAKIPNLDYLDLGWGGDVKYLRSYLPKTFFNIRLSPVEIARQTNKEIQETIIRLVGESANPKLTGLCCINMDDSVSDDKITTIFETVEELKKQ